MLLNKFKPYKPSKLILGGHLQTIWPRLIYKYKPNYKRELFLDSTGTTKVAYDFIYGNMNKNEIIVFFHGLEGGSYSHYATSFMEQVYKKNLNAVVVHFRGCGGVKNTANIAYHCGDSLEIEFVLSNLKKYYNKVYAVGVSLGGNALAKYLGEYQEKSLCNKAAIVSAPLNLPESSVFLSKSFISRKIYITYFLKTLIPKALEQKISDEIKLSLKSCKTLTEFDDLVTSKLHGFSSASDYYKKASAFGVLKNITIPTLIINSLNDPIVDPKSLPTENDVSDKVILLKTKSGGHAGFCEGLIGSKLTWLPNIILDFFK